MTVFFTKVVRFLDFNLAVYCRIILHVVGLAIHQQVARLAVPWSALCNLLDEAHDVLKVFVISRINPVVACAVMPNV